MVEFALHLVVAEEGRFALDGLLLLPEEGGVVLVLAVDGGAVDSSRKSVLHIGTPSGRVELVLLGSQSISGGQARGTALTRQIGWCHA